ncbi:hypothetical protein [Kocuria sp. CPCC 205261]|uniref:hypothetical protein n=1 Tax=Kocuria sp. CPCC 205261 TaxID=3073554 RepID=UPI0034D3C2EA
MPAPCPQAFRDDVVRVARTREDGVTIAQIAKDFGVHEMTLHKRIRQADIDDGSRPGRSREESTEMRDAKKRIRLLEQENEVLRRAAAYLSRANLPGKGSTRLCVSSPTMESPSRCPCGSSKLSRQPYYRWRTQQVTASDLVEVFRVNALSDAHRDDPEFGYRFLAGEAEAAGESMWERTAWRICRENQWWSVFGKKRGKNGKCPGPPVHDDLVRRDFTADDVNELWLTDITEHWTA